MNSISTVCVFRAVVCCYRDNRPSDYWVFWSHCLGFGIIGLRTNGHWSTKNMSSDCCVALLLVAVDVLLVARALVPPAVAETRVLRAADSTHLFFVRFSKYSKSKPCVQHLTHISAHIPHCMFSLKLFPNRQRAGSHAHKQTITCHVREAERTGMTGMTVMWCISVIVFL